MTSPASPSSPEPNTPPSAQSVDDQLERILLDAEESLRALREELAEHRRLQSQHDAVEQQLPTLLNATASRWSNVRVFFDELITELRESRRDAEDAKTAVNTPETEETPNG